MDVGEPTVRVFGPVEDQPVPTIRVGGSSSSGTRSGVGSRASETNTDDRETKRVRFTESRGQKRQGEDVEELAAKAEEQNLDADFEVTAHKTWRVEDVVWGCGRRTARTNEQLRTEQDSSVREDRRITQTNLYGRRSQR